MITIVNYGSGNISAISNIYKHLGIACEVAATADALIGAEKLVLPGVGAFDQTMLQLEQSGMRAVLDDLVLEQKKPVLGICVGMQIMARSSDEGNENGLGWIDGAVKRIDEAALSHKPYLPHMGWNVAVPQKDNPLFKGVDEAQGFYFLHSYYLSCFDEDSILASTCYGTSFTSAVSSGNIFGVQFHPEKSHQNGVLIFKNFAGL